MGIQSREGQITWTQDLAGSASTTVFPSGNTAGVAGPANGHSAARVHVGLDYRVASGTLSTQVALYGLTIPQVNTGSGTWSTSTWVYLGAMNGGASIGPNAATWTESATHIVFTEVFTVSGENYSRYATRAYGTGGTSPLVSTYIGFCSE